MGVSFAVTLWLITAAAHPYLDEGQRLYEAQKWEPAVAKLTMAANVPELSRADRRLAFGLLARCHLALGSADQAQEAFAKLLSRDPSAPAPEGAPKLREVHARAKQRLFPPDYVRLEALAAPPGEVWVGLVDPWEQVHQVLLSQAGPSLAFAESALKPGEGHHGAALAPDAERYFVRAVNGAGAQLAALGDASTPLKVEPRAPQILAIGSAPKAQRSRLPVWVCAAASALALGAGVALAIASGADSQQAGAAVFSSDRKALDDSAQGKALAANVLVGVAVVGGAGTAVLAWAW